MQKRTVGEVGNWTVIWWQVVSGILVPKIIKVWKLVFKWQSKMSGMFLRHSVIITLLQIVHRVCQWKNSENRSITGEDMDKSKVPRFWPILYIQIESALGAALEIENFLSVCSFGSVRPGGARFDRRNNFYFLKARSLRALVCMLRRVQSDITELNLTWRSDVTCVMGTSHGRRGVA